MSLTPAAREWQSSGEQVEFRGRRIFVHRREGDGPLLVLLHGFPSSSFDWRAVLADTTGPVLAFDFLGFGLSDKPRDHTYTLGWQADLTEELVTRYAPGREVVIVAHDMGTSVATELMARDIAGSLEMKIAAALLFNGSILLDRATPPLGQRLLRSRGGPIFARLSSKRFFKMQFGSVFSDAHPLTDAEADDQWSLLTFNGGRRIAHLLVNYMDERERFTERWHGAVRDWPGNLSLAWGMLDPAANVQILAGLRELRPGVPVTELAELGHYPQLEDPEAFCAVLRRAQNGAAAQRRSTS